MQKLDKLRRATALIDALFQCAESAFCSMHLKMHSAMQQHQSAGASCSRADPARLSGTATSAACGSEAVQRAGGACATARLNCIH
jgi:hypothetical protein